MREKITKTKIEILYSVVAVAVPFILVSLLVIFSHYPLWVKISIILIISISISSLLVYFAKNILSKLVPSDLQDEKGFFYEPRWKSWEFDNFVGEELLELYQDNLSIFKDYNKTEKNLHKMTDYSFLVLPIAKVYEGVLKRVLVKSNILQEEDLVENPTINIGGYFNPVGNQKIFDRLKDKARDKTVPHVIYSTYQECRNHIFHYDPYRDNRLKRIEDAEFYSRRILHAIDKVYESFK